MLSSSQHVKKDLVTTAIENGSFTTLCSCSWCHSWFKCPLILTTGGPFTLSLHLYRRCICCAALSDKLVPPFVVARQIKVHLSYEYLLTYHMLRVVKSFSFCTIGWTNNDPYRPRRKCSVLLHIPKTTENDPTILSVSIMPTWSRLMC